VDCDVYTDPQEALVVHPNGPLSEAGRLRLARCVVEDGWPLRRAAERFQVSPTTAKRWADRYRAAASAAASAAATAASAAAGADPTGRPARPGPEAMIDQSSRPHHSPHQTPTRTERRIAIELVRGERHREIAPPVEDGGLDEEGVGGVAEAVDDGPRSASHAYR
jgi:transposase-like protein